MGNYDTPGSMAEPKWGPIGKEVYERTYMRDGETWEDTVRRVVRGNTGLVDEKFIEPDEREKLFNMIYNFDMLPAGRHLWVSGVPGRQYVFNCHRAGFSDLVGHYSFMFNQLMQGGGVGANYSERYIEHLPKINNEVELHIVCRADHPDYEELLPYLTEWADCLYTADVHGLEDSREGWVDGLEQTLKAHLDGHEVLVLDVSWIRGRGEPIRGFGGTACGPAPLAKMLHDINARLNGAVGRRLTGLEHMENDHDIAQCVVAGNVRRSARMSIKSWRDPDIFEFIHCKQDGLTHWSTNISVEIDDEFFKAFKSKKNRLNEQAQLVYKHVIEGMLRDGEPGFYNLTLAQEGEVGDVGSTNPCGEIALEEWENCNLGHVNVGNFVGRPFSELEDAFRLMARFLIRATFCDIPDPRQREVVERNRRIGVGFFNFQSWLVQNQIRFSDSHRNRYVRKTLRDWKSVVDKEKRRYAFQLRIPEPIKGTTLAPTGSISQLAGAVGSGQTIYSTYAKRRVRYAIDSPEFKRLAAEGYETEIDVYDTHGKTGIVVYYYRDPLLDVVEDESLVEGASDVELADFLAVQAMYQECYADNAVSFTINVVPGSLSQEEAEKTIIHYLPYLKGTTIFPDKSRQQAPFERITKAEYELAEYVKSAGSGELACGPNGCPVK